MKYDCIILTDTQGFDIPMRTHGAFNISSYLRNNNYTVKTIDNQQWLWENYGDDLKSYINQIIGPNTVFVGISSTFGQLFNENFHEFIENFHYRYPCVKLILGGNGINTSKFFDKYKDKINLWVRGLGEDTILSFMRNQINDQKVTDPRSKNYDFRNQKNIYFPEDLIFKNEVLPITFARGCRFKCAFCRFPLLGRKPSDEYLRSEESIYSELIYNLDNFNTTDYMITDDTFNETTGKLETVAKAVKRTGVDMNFWSYIRIELLHKFPEQISLLQDIGVKAIFFGIESLNYESAKAIGKGLDTDSILETLNKVKKALGKHSRLRAGFIAGLPYETIETIDNWTNMLINGETALDFFVLTPLEIVSSKEIADAMFSGAYYSKFDLNRHKYGYEELENGGWKNQYWTSQEAVDYCKEFNRRMKRNSLAMKNGSYSINVQNLRITHPELTWNDLHGEILTEEQDQKLQAMLLEGSTLYRQQYKDKLFGGV